MAGLRRDLGFVEMAAIAASMMLGVGIFFGPSLTAREFPDSRIVLSLWALGGLVALAGAWVFGRLASLHPMSGGPYVYVRHAYGSWAAFLFAWTSFVIIAPTSMAVMAFLFASHLAETTVLSGTGRALVAVWSVVAVTFANSIGVKAGGVVQAFLTGMKIVLVAALVLLLFGSTGVPADASVDGGGRFSVAFVGILFAVGGWEYAVLASEEVRNPRRTIPRALFTGTAIVVVLYLLVVASYLAMLGPGGVADAVALAPEAADAALAGAGRWVGVGVAISAFGTLNAVILLGPRSTFAVARDGLLPEIVARVNPRWGTPVVAILLQAALATAFLLTGAFETVAAYTVIGTGVFIVLSAVALPKLRAAAGVIRRRRHTFEDAAAFLLAGVYAWFLVQLLVDDPQTAIVGLGLVVAGLAPFAFLHHLGYRLRPEATAAPD